MQRRSLPYLLLVSLFLFLYACFSDCKDRLFTPDVREYFLDFKEGSYWIYRNMQNGDIDSIYFISQSITHDAMPRQFGVPTCYQEYAGARFEGNTRSLSFSYTINSWSNAMNGNYSFAFFSGEYDLNKLTTENFSGKTYDKVIAFENCCLSRNCYGCNQRSARITKMYFAPKIGLVRWEAENHPQYGNAVYELVRYKVI